MAAAMVVVLLAVVGTPAAAQSSFNVQQTLSPSTASTRYGNGVDIDGNRAVVGAPFDNPLPSPYASGAAYVYVKSGATWTVQQRIVASDPQAEAMFGWAVAVSGNTVFIGAPSGITGAGNPRPGAVYVFELSGSTWTQTAKITPSNGFTLDSFGQNIEADGNRIIVGAPAATGSGGKAYVFTRSGGGWTQTELVPPSVFANDRYGSGVGLSGTTACVGAPLHLEGGQRGVVHIYEESGGIWTLQQRVFPGTSASSAGVACAVDQNTLVIGDTLPSGVPNAGTAYVFTRSGTVWSLQQQVNPSDAETRGFGRVVDVVGDTAIVSAPDSNLNAATPGTYGHGQVYVFGRSGGTWTERQKVRPPTLNQRIELGSDVVLDATGVTLFVGARHIAGIGTATVLGFGAATGPPTAPTNFQASVAGNTVSMSWGAPSGGAPPTSYTLLARTSGGATLAAVPLGLAFSYTTPAPNGVYVVSVAATNASGNGPESNAVTLTVPASVAPPGAPTGLGATVAGSTVTFDWSAPATGGAPTGYTLVAGLTPGFVSSIAALPLSPSSTSAAVPNVPAGTFYVRLLAQNSGGSSALSNEVQVVVAGPAAPGTPTLNPATVSGNTVSLSWSPGGGGAPTGFTLTATNPGGTVLATVPVTGLTASFGGVPSGTYLIRVTASNSVGSSAPSNQVTVVVP